MGTESRPRTEQLYEKGEARDGKPDHLQRTIPKDGDRTRQEGDKPIDIFRDAGLDSRIIGCKRIERCMSRWRARDRETRERGNGERLGDR